MTHSNIAIVFFCLDTATTEFYTLSLHDALPISKTRTLAAATVPPIASGRPDKPIKSARGNPAGASESRSEEHTSELQSRRDLVCRLLLEKKKPNDDFYHIY